MILFFLFLLIVAIIFLFIFVFYNLTNYSFNKFTIIKHINFCKSPSFIVLSNSGIYTNFINNYNDKILIIFTSDNNINVSFLNSSNFQLINIDNINTIVSKVNDDDLLLFTFNYRIFFNYPFRITSIQTKNTFSFDFNNVSFFNNDLGYFVISSLSPFIIYKIDDINFKIIHEFLNVSWINNYNFIKINSNPILIDSLYWIIGSTNDKLIFIIFDFIQKKIINHFYIYINFHINKGLIYNKLDNTFLIPIIKDNQIQIFKIKKNDLK